MSCLIVSFVESSNHCILASSFLIHILLSLFEVLDLVVIFVTSSSTSKRISYASSIAFSVLEVLPVLFEEGFSPCSRCNPPIYDRSSESEISSIGSGDNSYIVEDSEREADEYSNQGNSDSDLKWAPEATRKVWVENKTIHLIDCPKAGNSHITMELGDVTKDFAPCDYCKPLQYMSMEERLGFEQKRITYVIIGVVVVTVSVLFYAIFKIKKNNQSLNKDIGIQAVHEKREIEEIPDGFNIVDGLPATVGHRHRYGLYSVYVTPHGVHYHRRKKCAGNHAHLTNLYLVYQKRKPCANCCQNHKPNMDFTWYEKYMTFQKENN